MEEQGLQYLVALANKKKRLLDHFPLHYFLRAMMAGIFVGFVIITCFRTGEYFRVADSPFAYLFPALFFGIALILIIYGGAELFTGNTAYFTVAYMRDAVTLRDLGRNWGACYLGNAVGAIFFAVLFYLTGIFSHIPNDHLMHEIVSYKMHGSVTALFFKGILCNWLVCLACYLPSQVKGDGAKMAMMIAVVFLFFSSGFEHSIANLSLFSIALVSPHPDTITIGNAIYNLIPVTLGNIVGGAIFVGMLYQFLSKSSTKLQLQDNMNKITEITEKKENIK